MFNFIRKLLADIKAVNNAPSPDDIERTLKEIQEQRSKDVTMRFTRGNVSLQAGNYVTAKQIDETFGGPAPWRS